MPDKDSVLKKLWNGWKKIAAKIAHVQGTLLLSLIYFVVVTPIAVLFQLTGQDPLVLKDVLRKTYWLKRRPMPSVPDFLKKEF
jgi:hypothetical protein